MYVSTHALLLRCVADGGGGCCRNPCACPCPCPCNQMSLYRHKCTCVGWVRGEGVVLRRAAVSRKAACRVELAAPHMQHSAAGQPVRLRTHMHTTPSTESDRTGSFQTNHQLHHAASRDAPPRLPAHVSQEPRAMPPFRPAASSRGCGRRGDGGDGVITGSSPMACRQSAPSSRASGRSSCGTSIICHITSQSRQVARKPRQHAVEFRHTYMGRAATRVAAASGVLSSLLLLLRCVPTTTHVYVHHGGWWGGPEGVSQKWLHT